MHADVAGDGGAVMACFLQGVNLVSLLTGKLLCSRHRAPFDLVVEEHADDATAACPFTTKFKVALTS
jgi:hypothetical protein